MGYWEEIVPCEMSSSRLNAVCDSMVLCSVPTVTLPLPLRPFTAVTHNLFSTVCRFNFPAVCIFSRVANEDVVAPCWYFSIITLI